MQSIHDKCESDQKVQEDCVRFIFGEQIRRRKIGRDYLNQK